MKKNKNIAAIIMAMSLCMSMTAFAEVGPGIGLGNTSNASSNSSQTDGPGAVTQNTTPASGQTNGWVNTTSGWTYYVNGVQLTGWVQDNGLWYYINPANGIMKTGWIQSPASGIWYYLGGNGVMWFNTVTPDGYHVDQSGAWNQSIAKTTSNNTTGTTAKNSSDHSVGWPTTTNSSSNDDNDTSYWDTVEPDPEYDHDAWIQEVLDLVNEKREAAGVGDLTLDDTLCEAADIRAEEAYEKFSHTRPDGSQWYTALDSLGFPVSSKEAENLVEYAQSPKEAVASWYKSSGHKKNMLTSSFNLTGIGVYKHNNQYYWAQEFSN